MIFVTGATGLIGSFLLRELLARGLAVRALHRGDAPLAPAGVEWVQGDILDVSLLASIISPEITHVFHCAGLVSYAPQDADALLQINAEGTAAIVDACLVRPGIRLGYVSSVAALGQPVALVDGQTTRTTQQVVTEKATWDLGASHPPYATSKYLGELEVWRGGAEGLSSVIINPSVVLGPGDWYRSSTRLLRYAYDEHYFYTRGLLNFVDVRDVVAQFLRLMLDLPAAITTERYILNGGALPLGDFLRAAATAFGRRPPTIAVPNWAAELVWRLEHGRAVLTGARPLITRDTARAGRQHVYYDASKVQLATGLAFRELLETIDWATQGLKTNRTTFETVVS